MNWNMNPITYIQKSVRLSRLLFSYAGLLLVLSQPPASLAQELSFNPIKVSVNNLDPIRSIQLIDLDQDGGLDILTATSNGIAWQKNLKLASPSSSNGFGPYQSLTLDSKGVQFVYGGDVDLDGDIDLVANRSSSNDELVVWYENVDGVFNSDYELIAELEGKAEKAVLIDVDKDGRIDVVTASDDEILWHQNIAGSEISWQEQSIEANSAAVKTLAMADINGDSYADVVLGLSNKVVIYENPKQLGQSWLSEDIPVNSTNLVDISVADMNQDGRIDIIIAEATDHKIIWFENISDPVESDNANFNNAENIIDNRSLLSSPSNIVAADLDGDGDTDIAVTSLGGSRRVDWYEQTTTTEGLIEWRSQANGIDTSLPFAKMIETADIDGDGDFDLLVGAFKSSQNSVNLVGWYRNDTIHRNSSFKVPPILIHTFTGATAVYSADLNRDKASDAILIHNNTISWIANPHVPHITNWAVNQVDILNSPPKQIKPVDFDLDGWVDLIVAVEDEVFRYTNPGPSSNSWAKLSIEKFNGQTVNDVQLADLDQNGYVDILIGTEGASPLIWYANGDGNLSKKTIDISPATNVQHMAAADYDHDGDVDIVLATDDAFSGKLLLIENSGDAQLWDNLDSLDDANNVSHLILADMNDDAFLDIVVASEDQTVSWYKNDRGGPQNSNFGQHILLNDAPLPAEPTALFTQDLDKDGDVDVFVDLAGGKGAYWFENSNQNETFSTAPLIEDANSSFFSLAPIDYDDDLDLYAIQGDKLIWLPNGGGQFGYQTTPSSYDLSNAQDDVLMLEASHNGRLGDASLTLTHIELLFTDGHTPMGITKFNTIVQELFIYEDSIENGMWEVGDNIVASVNDFELTNGRMTVTLDEALAKDDEPKTLFVILSLFENARQNPSEHVLVVAHLTENPADHSIRQSTALPISRAVDSNSMIALNLETTVSETAVVIPPTQIQYLPLIAKPSRWVQVGNMPGTISQFYDVAVCGNTLLAGTDKGIYRFNGTSWQREGQTPEKKVFHITFGTDTCAQAYASVLASSGANNIGGIWCGRTNSGNWNWNQLDSASSRQNADTVLVNNNRVFVGVDVNGVAWAPELANCTTTSNWTSALSQRNVFGLNEHDGVIWAATWGHNVYRSTNNGDSWIPVGSGNNRYFEAIGDNSGNRIAGGQSNLGRWAGNNWQSVGNTSSTYAVELFNGCFYTGQKQIGVTRSCGNTTSWSGFNDGLPSNLFQSSGRVYGLYYLEATETLYAATTSGIFMRTLP